MKTTRAFGIAMCSLAAAGVLALGGASTAHADPNWGTPPAEVTGPVAPGADEGAAPDAGEQELASTAMDSNWG
ncbi:hypothetical protein [Streptomyces sp. PA5.6]|uniref:hypothetical protein n=1 Tax=Streptomyces sp. PA5.6 TaxID=3035651 RepID=UPI0039049899